MTFLDYLLVGALLGALVLNAALFSGLLHICGQRNEYRDQLEQINREADGLQDENNDKARRLTRRRTPFIPAQRGATP